MLSCNPFFNSKILRFTKCYFSVDAAKFLADDSLVKESERRYVWCPAFYLWRVSTLFYNFIDLTI